MDILYKYYPPQTATLVLEKKSIRFSPIVEFNDPFECNVFSNREFEMEDFAYELYCQLVEVFNNGEELSARTEESEAIAGIFNHINSLDLDNEKKHDLIIELAGMFFNKKFKDGPSKWQKKYIIV